MGFIGKLFALVMFPLSILIVLEQLKVVTVVLPVNKVFLGAGLMVALQVITLLMMERMNHHLSFMNVATAIVFMATAVAAVGSVVLGYYPKEMPIILGVMMFVEALYALH